MSNTELITTENMEAYGRAAQDDAVQRMLKFVKGDFLVNKEIVPLGSVFLAHTKAWTKSWIHFDDKKVVERKNYKMILGERVPERDQIPDQDETKWEKDPNGKPQDPWSLQYLLPFENMETGAVDIFVASSFGGRRAIGSLCDTWYKRTRREAKHGQPIIKIGVTSFPTKNWGDVKAPLLEIIGWDDSEQGVTVKDIDPNTLNQGAAEVMNDEIPF